MLCIMDHPFLFKSFPLTILEMSALVFPVDKNIHIYDSHFLLSPEVFFSDAPQASEDLMFGDDVHGTC